MTRPFAGMMLLAVAALLSRTADAQVLFRMPLSMTHCGQSCSVSAHYDTNRAGGLRDYGCGTWTYEQHDGTDYAVGSFAGMDAGRPVLAAADGVVIAAHDGEFDRCTTANCGTANYVMVRHDDGKVTWYWHLKKWSVLVEVGQAVTCGQQLGLAGSSGLSTGPHLHFGTQYTQGGAIDDPYASDSGCGGTVSWWNSQGAYGSLPSPVCQGGNGFCVGKADGYWCNGDTLTVCGGGGVASETDCPHGCESMPPGVPDRCAEPPPSTGVVKGVVWDRSVTDDAAASLELGARLPGAVITCSCGETTTARADDGFWSLTLDPGTYTLSATLDGYESAQREVQVTGGAEQWASMGLVAEPPPAEDPGERPSDPPDAPPDEPGDEPNGQPVDGIVVVPSVPIAPAAPGDGDGEGTRRDGDVLDGDTTAPGCRCVSGQGQRGGMGALLGLLLVGGVVFSAGSATPTGNGRRRKPTGGRPCRSATVREALR